MRSHLQWEEFERNRLAAMETGPATDDITVQERIDDQSGEETIHDWDDVSYDWFDDMDFDVGVGD